VRRMMPAFAWLGFLWVSGLCVQDVNAQQPADSQTGNRLYVVAFVDIAGAGPKLDESIQLLREFVADSLKDPGAIRIEFLQQDNRHNHFALVEVWQSREAFEAHLGLAHTKQFREKVQPMLGSPFDERLHVLLP